MGEPNSDPVTGRNAPSPDTATWNERVDVDLELLGDRDAVDEVDIVDENWAPGEGRPGMAADEVLHVHRDDDPTETTADELEVDELTAEELALATDELFEGEEGED